MAYGVYGDLIIIYPKPYSRFRASGGPLGQFHACTAVEVGLKEGFYTQDPKGKHELCGLVEAP